MGIFSKKQAPASAGAIPPFASQPIDAVGRELYSQYRAGYENNPFVFRAVNIRANAVASVKFLIFDINGNEITNIDHPLYKLLRRPNPCMTGSEFIKDLEQNIGINGNAYIFLIRTTFSGIGEMWSISPDKITPIRTYDIFDPVTSWTVNLGSRTISVPPENIIHIKLNSGSDSFFGVSPMVVAKRAIDMQNAATRWNTSALTNGARPSLHLKVRDHLTKSQKRDLREDMRAGYQGVDNNANVMVTGDNMDVTPLGFTALEMDFSNGMVMNSREIAVAYDTPSELIGDVANKTYANAAEAGRQFAVNCVKPLLDQLWETMDRVITPEYSDVGRITYDIASVQDLAGDQTALYAAVTGADFLSVNEKREIFGYDDVGSDGDIILTSMSRVPLAEAVTEMVVPPMQDTEDNPDA